MLVFLWSMRCEKLSLNIYRDGNEYAINFKDGNSLKPLKKIGKTKRRA